MRIILRPAAIEDRYALWRVHTSAIRVSARSHYYDTTQIEAWAGRLSPDGYRLNSDVFLAAEAEDGSVVGFVDPEFGRRGIGRQLLEALEELARRQDLTNLGVDASLNAVKFYECAGYRQAEPTVCVYGKAAVEVPGMLMTKSLE